jgi:hypothetical protein
MQTGSSNSRQAGLEQDINRVQRMPVKGLLCKIRKKVSKEADRSDTKGKFQSKFVVDSVGVRLSHGPTGLKQCRIEQPYAFSDIPTNTYKSRPESIGNDSPCSTRVFVIRPSADSVTLQCTAPVFSVLLVTFAKWVSLSSRITARS